MAFSDPQSITVNAVAQSMPRTGSGINQGLFSKDDATAILSVSHTYGKRTRRAMKFTMSKIAADPLISANNIKYSSSITLVVDAPITGYTVAELKQIADGFVAYLSASSGAKITQFLGGEA